MNFESSIKEVAVAGTPRRALRWAGVVFAIIFPSVVTWAYFVSAGDLTAVWQKLAYIVGKPIQFCFPMIWVWCVLKEPLRTGRVSAQGVWLGVAFSVAVVGAGLLLFNFVLRDTATFVKASELVRAKVNSFGISSAGRYAALGVFYALFHSLLEEYYWRWFVFRQLRQLSPLWPAVIGSSLAFTAHHVIVLNQYFQGLPWLVALFSAAVAVGGAVWALLYERANSLLAPWLSHLLIDAGIFWIGYELLREGY
jgi:membrane protease YdiL (CAAX protease family)